MRVKSITVLNPAVLTAFFVLDENLDFMRGLLPEEVRNHLLTTNLAEDGRVFHHISSAGKFVFYGLGKVADLKLEKIRRTIHAAVNFANGSKEPAMTIVCFKTGLASDELGMALGETPVLSNYQFLTYKSDKKNKNTLEDVFYISDVTDADFFFNNGKKVAEATCLARNLVNEPPNVLTATELALRTKQIGEQFGYKTEILEKEKIEALKMGGLLAVNRGSQEPPTFSVLEWKPEKPANTKPIVLIGKGLVFDTGGLSLKPTAGSMDSMKCDMAGGAVVIGVLAALADTNVPLHVIGLIPSTDNRPGENAYTPNDVITMYSGTTVEVLNTDAEGRLILADALHYAKKYEPELVIDLATLTGAAVVALGTTGCVMCSTASRTLTNYLLESGERTYERCVEFPLWDEYREQLNSDIADMKNIGGKNAGAITAAKFLQQFVAYPWIHLDIAGPAWLDTADSYRGKNGTGWGVRLLVDFLARYKSNVS